MRNLIMSHYSLAQKPKQLLRWAENIAIDIHLREIQYPVLVYRGMSGVSSATALSLQLHILGIDHGMVYVRKDNEDSHGEPIEKEPFADSAPLTFIFVDDFVKSGLTKQKCLDKINYRVFWPEGKEDFDYCAVQQSFYADGYLSKLCDPEGKLVCKN